MIITQESHFAPHAAPRARSRGRLALARRDGAGADGRSEHAGESRAPLRRRLPSQRRYLRQMAA